MELECFKILYKLSPPCLNDLGTDHLTCKNSESDNYFFPSPKSEYFFSNIGNHNIFLEKNIPPLQVKWSFP